MNIANTNIVIIAGSGAVPNTDSAEGSAAPVPAICPKCARHTPMTRLVPPAAHAQLFSQSRRFMFNRPSWKENVVNLWTAMTGDRSPMPGPLGIC